MGAVFKHVKSSRTNKISTSIDQQSKSLKGTASVAGKHEEWRTIRNQYAGCAINPIWIMM